MLFLTLQRNKNSLPSKYGCSEFRRADVFLVLPALLVLPLAFSPKNQLGFLACLAGLMIIDSFGYWVLDRLMFARDLRRLKRKAIWSFPCNQTTFRHRRTTLVLGFFGSLLFVLGGFLNGRSASISWA